MSDTDTNPVTVPATGEWPEGDGSLAPLLPIRDPASFARVTASGHELAALYAFANLDCLVDLVRLVAADFFARPHLYTEIADEELYAQLARLDARTGSDELYLSQQQRRAVFAPLFGGETGGDFTRLRDEFLSAAATFAEWSQATGIPMLRERVRTTHRPLREFLLGLQGSSVRWSHRVLSKLADEVSYPILREAGVIAVFGLNQPASGDWPYREDANGDKTVEQISYQLDKGAARPLTREGFSVRQRVALRGAEALAFILEFREDHPDDELDQLITRAYTWHAALKAAKQAGTAGSGMGGPNGTGPASTSPAGSGP